MALLASQRGGSFVEEEVQRTGVGGGVIPIAFDGNGRLRVLLGRERFVSHWKGSCRWSGFEGSRKQGETLWDASVREFVEESLGTVASREACAHVLTHKQYWIRIVLGIKKPQRSETTRYHTTYVVLMHYDASLPLEFRSVRSHIEYTDRLLQQLRFSRPAFLGTEDVGPITTDEDGYVRVCKMRPVEPCVLHPPWEHEDRDLLRAVVGSERSTHLLRWQNTRERLARALQRHHEAVQARFDTRWGIVQDVHICKDFLEKDQIRWWSEAELWDALRGRGTTGSERFRPYFLPVLQTLLEELRDHPPDAATATVFAAPHPSANPPAADPSVTDPFVTEPPGDGDGAWSPPPPIECAESLA